VAQAPQEAIVTSGNDKLTLSAASFSALPGWRKDKHADAIVAFLASCKKLAAMGKNARVGTGPFGGKARQWLPACKAAAKLPAGDHKKARQFFEREFRAYATRGSSGTQGKITGYYVQPLRGSRTRKGRYQFPLYRRPTDLVSVSLSDFVTDGRSRRIWGRMNDRGTKLEPYPTRLDYRLARTKSDAHVLLWVDDPGDAIQVEIEGSGRAQLDDGSVIMIGFAGKNGRKSGKLGTVARAMRALSKSEGPGPWSAEALQQYQDIADIKTSIVFFESDERPGAIGSQNVVLTPQRSLAVDRAVISLSTPVWVDTRAPSSPRGRIGTYRRLLIAQDTGGAIVGTMRGDIYWGQDRDAVALGRRVNNPGRMWLLLPRAIKVH
jgi:membrane-bound lytic murein transglycosylase A